MFISVVILACSVVCVRFLDMNVILGWFGCRVVICLDANTTAWCLCEPRLTCCTLLTLASFGQFQLQLAEGWRWQRRYVPNLCERKCLGWEARASELVLCAPYRKRFYVSHHLIRLREPVQTSKLLETGRHSFYCLLDYLVCVDFLAQMICLHFMMSFFENVFEFDILVPLMLLFPTH